MNNNNSNSNSSRSPFTVSQWQELEHQALIYKYMLAGLPVPHDLVIPILKNFQSISTCENNIDPSFLSYCSFYGKKVDPEPGRCRRTDGKKWRCSKEAYPDSKYCERHMHRGRNRSRKPVESQTMAQSSSAVTSMTVTSSNSATGNFQNLTTNAFGNSTQGVVGSSTNQSHYHLDSIPYGIPSKEYRYLKGHKSEGGEQSLFPKALGSNKVIGMESHIDNTFMPIGDSSFSTSKSKNNNNSNSMLQGDYLQQSFLSSEFVKHESQSLRPFFDEWPKNKDSWSGLEDEESNHKGFSTTQLSMSIPISSSNFSTTTSQSPHSGI
ncbi:PREDICTED: growth-regulating factor 4-like [Lupinus angustifolius]|uniref:growth-regulating factor 4-like n=2 Tax=Lupinus angustifolius TaxID=3871 RepID=UPI00092E744A|nr:PREDICTED: growth-regulating factor 4-like [Lupinus angustifolius]